MDQPQTSPSDAPLPPQTSSPIGKTIAALLVCFALVLMASLIGFHRLAISRQTERSEPLELTFKYRSVEIDASTAQAIVSRHSVVPVKDSAYAWTLLNDAELAKLLVLEGKLALVLSSKERKINLWPMIAESDTYAMQVNAQKPNWYSEAGGLTVFLGARRIASARQARIDGHAFYNRANVGSAFKADTAPRVIQGNFFYEGAVPPAGSHLVFFSRLGGKTWHTVIFEVV